MTERYDYMEHIYNDVMRAITENYSEEEIKRIVKHKDHYAEVLFNEFIDDDSVTGNGSGSYTFSSLEAEENLCHNWELIEQAADAYSIDPVVSRGAEYWDVVIRCYLLEEAIWRAIEHLDENTD